MFFERLKELQQKNLYRQIKDRASPQGPRIVIDGRELINFASNDYLGLANHPDIIASAIDAVKEFGFGSGASRLLGGGAALHKRLEDKVAQFKGTEASLMFNSGYSANTGIIPSIAGEGDIILSDELNHASIIDGCRLSRARTLMYKHRDITHLSALIRKELSLSDSADGRFIIITDSVFSMEGDIAPLSEIYNVCLALNSEPRTQDSILLYIDDAHGTGVLGNGRGALAHFNIRPEPWVIQMGTCSKALGSFGAFIAADRDVVEWLTNTSRSFIFSTVLPACIAAASLKAVELIEETPQLIERLWRNRAKLVNGLRERGYDAGTSGTPVIPLRLGGLEDTLNMSQHLYNHGIYAPAIRPPAVKEPLIRITVTAAHSEEDIDALVQALHC